VWVRSSNYRVGATQSPTDWHGRGAGNAIGEGPLTALDIWLGTVCMLVELKEAEARPTKATSSAKTRTATFIFGNLSELDFEGEFSLGAKHSIEYWRTKLDYSL
jgi:hypothetical protein